MNFFWWIREGVRQSVLQGVSDAVDCLGAPSNEDDIRPALLEFLQKRGSESPPLPSSRTNRKKLGRSLTDIQAAASKAA